MDGPVVRAARAALDAGRVEIVLPYVPEAGEAEIHDAFARATRARALGGAAREVADRWFFETVVRVHRAGEGAPFTGLKPAGLDVGPIIPVAEKAIDSRDVTPLAEALVEVVRRQVEHRFAHLEHFRAHAAHGVDAERFYVSAALGLQVWAHQVYTAATSEPHAAHEH
jgi:hypothetical protein